MRNDVAMDLMRRAVAIAEVQVPELAGGQMGVPLDYFSDPAQAAKERELFETSPLALVASTELAGPHDYLVRNAVGRSVLLTRDGDGVAHAFLNYCRHRGAEVAQGCGTASRFTCPYHAWVYDSLGRVVGMPLRDRQGAFDFSSYGLVELPAEERHGFVWAVLRPGHPIDVAAHLGDLDDEIRDLGCDKMHYYSSIAEAPLAANWKSVAEGLLEGLHVPYVHADTFNLNPQAVNVDIAFYDTIGPHIRWGLPMFGQDEAKRLRDTPESEWCPEESIGCIWLISPGLLLANELYGLIYADLTPGSHVQEAFFRYGWLSPVTQPPPGMPSPEDMAARAARAVGQDQVVWEGCGRGLARGAHPYELIGRNELGVQLFHRVLAERTGYTGLVEAGRD
jgi:phenylpropionate dioxygenase-like ring-hydroxylating dioxygenase large terminal subunit